MIPKVIHYCWFGGKPLPELALKCIKSWKKFLPDYEIKEWNEQNFDVNINSYTREAYEAKKYAFVSDFARFWILYHHGGLYFDVDVEVIKPLDKIIAEGPFLGREDTNHRELKLQVNPGLGFGAYAHQNFLKEILEQYSHLQFINSDGTYNTKTIVEYTTEMLYAHGLNYSSSVQNCAGFQIYPKEYFSPKNIGTRDIVLTENTYTIHHYDGSWLSDSARKRQKIKEKLSPKFVRIIQNLLDFFRK